MLMCIAKHKSLRNNGVLVFIGRRFGADGGRKGNLESKNVRRDFTREETETRAGGEERS